MSDVNEFFEDLLERLKKIAPEKEEDFKKVIVQLRWDWRSAQFYITPQTLTQNTFLQIRKEFEKFLISVCKEKGVPIKEVRRRLFQPGRPNTQPFKEDKEN